jgi:hypothetical protein
MIMGILDKLTQAKFESDKALAEKIAEAIAAEKKQDEKDQKSD